MEGDINKTMQESSREETKARSSKCGDLPQKKQDSKNNRGRILGIRTTIKRPRRQKNGKYDEPPNERIIELTLQRTMGEPPTAN